MDMVTDFHQQNHLLKALLAHKGNYISGEMISEEVGVTRAAIWKQVKELRSLGYIIKSAPRRGYKLVESPDLLLAEEIWARANLKTWGQRIYYKEKVDSTNIFAKGLAGAGEPEGTLIIAEEQETGRGRLGRPWVSSTGGLWFSLILRPKLLPQEVAKFTLLAGVVLAEVLAGLGLPVSIKWPNDLLVQGKKICGILTELSAEMDGINYIVLGIGLNVNNQLPQELKGQSTTLSELLGKTLNRAEILARILEGLERAYYEAGDKGFDEILNRWRSWCKSLGQKVKIISREGSFEGTALDIDDTGALLVKRDDGVLERVLSGDVSLRPAK